MSQNKNTQIKLLQVEYLYKHLLSVVGAVFGILSVIYFTFQGMVDESNLNIWYSLGIIISIYRLIIYYSYKKCDDIRDKVDLYYKLYFLGVLASGVLWGSSAFMIFPESSEYQMLLLMMIGGLSSGSSASVASRVEMFYSYLLISLLPLLYAFLTISTSPVANGLVIAVLVYMLMLSTIAKKISINVNNDIKLIIEHKELQKLQEQKVIEANEANMAKSKFLSVMSHEIRTPLNAIIGFIKILKKDEKNSEKIKYLDTIDKSSYILLNVLNDILDITKIESGKFTIEKVDFNPKEEFLLLIGLFEQVSNEKGVILVNSISDTLPDNIISDKLRLEQIVSNLLSNAVKFTDKDKSVELIVRFDENTSSLHVEVKDEGVGIANENIDKILEDFTQADSSVSRKYGGTGLGLSISKKLLEMLGSKLHVESELGQGSSFSFDILVDVVGKNSVDESDDIEVDFGGKKVLVAEDNKTNQMLIEILLEDMNLEVSMANDGQEAVDMCKVGDFDIILMDINMPNKNGIEAMHDIRECGLNSGFDKPIIALTANSVSGDREKYLEDGFDDYVAKPIENEELVRVLKKYLS